MATYPQVFLHRACLLLSDWVLGTGPVLIQQRAQSVSQSVSQSFIHSFLHSRTHSFIQCAENTVTRRQLEGRRYSGRVHVAVAVQRGLQSIISDLRLLDPNIELRTPRGLWFRYQFANE